MSQNVGEPKTDHRDAKAQAKASKAYAKAQRPFYKKKRYWLLAAIILIVIIVVASGSGGASDDHAVPPSNHSTQKHKGSRPDAGAPSKDVAPQMTSGQENALQAGQNYVDTMPFSHDGLIRQLSSKMGDGYSKADATFAANHVKVDWNAEAVEAAKNYLDTMPMSRDGLIRQLTSSMGDQYTQAQAEYAADKVL